MKIEGRALRALLLGGLLAAGALGLAVFSAVAQEPRSAFTGEGSGVSAVVAQARGLGLDARRLVSGPLGIASDAHLDPARAVLLVVAPDRPYSTEEQRRVEAFLRAGGRAVVADNFGEGSTLTAPFGIVFQRVRLVEENASAPQHVVDGRAFPLHLRNATALQLAPGVPAAATTSPASFLDLDGDGLIGAGDPHGPFPLAAEVTVGEGRLVVLSDPEMLRPAATDAALHAPWREALLRFLLPDGGTLIVDESHTPSDDPTVSGAGAIVKTAGSQWGAAILGLASLGLLAATAFPRVRNLWGPHRFRPDRYVRRDATAPGTPTLPPDGQRQMDSWTSRGMVALLACPALAFLALVTGNAEAGWAASLLGVAAAASLSMGRPRVHATRRLSEERVSEETTVQVQLRLESTGRAVEVEARDALPPEIALAQGTNWSVQRPPRGGLDWNYSIKPALRGPYPIGPLVLRRLDPLGLHVRESAAADAAQLEVLPRKEPLNRTPFKTRIPSVTLGPHLVNRAGDGSEFHSLREYQEGDSFRAINWRASARSTQLVVSQRVHESMTTLTLFLDARAASGAGPANRTPLADGCRAALSLAAGALQVRDRVRILVYGNGVTELPPGRGARQIHELTDLLATLDARGNTPFRDAVATALPSLRSGNPAILLSGLEADPTIPEAMRQLRSRGLLCLTVASPIATRPVHDDEGAPEEDAAAIQAQREATLQALRAAGIPTFETKPGVPLDHLFRLGGSA